MNVHEPMACELITLCPEIFPTRNDTLGAKGDYERHSTGGLSMISDVIVVHMAWPKHHTELSRTHFESSYDNC